MISLDDTGLARLLIAAGAIPRRDRPAWLAAIAGELEAAAAEDRRKSASISNARRQREFRARRRNELLQLKITIPREDIVAALTAVGALDQREAADNIRVEQALSAQVADWAAAWAERT